MDEQRRVGRTTRRPGPRNKYGLDGGLAAYNWGRGIGSALAANGGNVQSAPRVRAEGNPRLRPEREAPDGQLAT